jgi:hypothetical protein
MSKSATADFDAAAGWISKEIHSPGRRIETCRSRQQSTSMRRRDGFLRKSIRQAAELKHVEVGNSRLRCGGGMDF